LNIKNIFFWKKKVASPVHDPIKNNPTEIFSPQKQAALEKMCDQLFKKEGFVTAGKLQFIGLTAVKKRLGKRWLGLSRVVYETVEDVIATHVKKSDISIRYKEDTYVIIFAQQSPEESARTSQLIVAEITQRLFALNDDEIKKIELKSSLHHLREKGMKWRDIISEDTLYTAEVATAAPKPLPNPAPAADYSYIYMPLWDVRRNALTTYLCLIARPDQQGNDFEYYQNILGRTTITEKANIDIAVLNNVTHDLQNMATEGRALLIACPVQHETLLDHKSFELYKKRLSEIPAAQRKFLILLVLSAEAPKPTKNSYWFVESLLPLCRHVYAELSLRSDVNFEYLRTAGIAAAGIRLPQGGRQSEAEIINTLNSFGARAKAVKFPGIFVLDIPSLSLATSAVCAGYGYLSGAAIHESVTKPDSIYRYEDADLFSDLT
ncbi:MAG: hypothetical protein KKA05_01295, partial [Alphaproteobacteria bacterium]|nr:hypothetical protein [Alphaproteobacteria bacterium]